jgi:hypothetical protein
MGRSNLTSLAYGTRDEGTTRSTQVFSASGAGVAADADDDDASSSAFTLDE